jgi:hypothetical protein
MLCYFEWQPLDDLLFQFQGFEKALGNIDVSLHAALIGQPAKCSYVFVQALH